MSYTRDNKIKKGVYDKDAAASHKSRVVNSFIITTVMILVLLMLGYHFIWSFKVIINQPYGTLLNNLVYGPGTFLANAGLSFRFLRYLNKTLVEDKVDSDYKKYF